MANRNFITMNFDAGTIPARVQRVDDTTWVNIGDPDQAQVTINARIWDLILLFEYCAAELRDHHAALELDRHRRLDAVDLDREQQAFDAKVKAFPDDYHLDDVGD